MYFLVLIITLFTSAVSISMDLTTNDIREKIRKAYAGTPLCSPDLSHRRNYVTHNLGIPSDLYTDFIAPYIFSETENSTEKFKNPLLLLDFISESTGYSHGFIAQTSLGRIIPFIKTIHDKHVELFTAIQSETELTEKDFEGINVNFSFCANALERKTVLTQKILSNIDIELEEVTSFCKDDGTAKTFFLCKAAAANNPQIFKMLLDKGAIPYMQELFFYGFPDCLKILREYPNIKLHQENLPTLKLLYCSVNSKYVPYLETVEKIKILLALDKDRINCQHLRFFTGIENTIHKELDNPFEVAQIIMTAFGFSIEEVREDERLLTLTADLVREQTQSIEKEITIIKLIIEVLKAYWIEPPQKSITEEKKCLVEEIFRSKALKEIENDYKRFLTQDWYQEKIDAIRLLFSKLNIEKK